MPPLRISLLAIGLLAGGTVVPAADPAPVPAPVAAPVVAPAPTARVLRGLVYATPGGVELKLDLHLPLTAPAKPVPLLVWIHGGGWQEGSRGFCPLAPLVKQGYAVASLSYRFTQVASFPAQIEDCRAAIRWLRSQAGVHGYDPARIGVCGESAGGLLAALLGTENDPAGDMTGRVQAVVALCPPTDLTLDDVDQARVPELLASQDPKQVRLGKIFQSRVTSLQAALGGPVAEHRDLARRMSPVTHVTKDDPPFYIVHGDKDELIPMAQSELLQAALQKVGVDATLEIVPGAGHGFGRLKPDMLARVNQFYDRTLKAP